MTDEGTIIGDDREAITGSNQQSSNNKRSNIFAAHPGKGVKSVNKNLLYQIN